MNCTAFTEMSPSMSRSNVLCKSPGSTRMHSRARWMTSPSAARARAGSLMRSITDLLVTTVVRLGLNCVTSMLSAGGNGFTVVALSSSDPT